MGDYNAQTWPGQELQIDYGPADSRTAISCAMNAQSWYFLASNAVLILIAPVLKLIPSLELSASAGFDKKATEDEPSKLKRGRLTHYGWGTFLLKARCLLEPGTLECPQKKL